jgi:hypothetical protein
MKTKFYQLGLTALVGLSMQAQVTLTQSNHAPVPGDVNLRRECDSIGNVKSVFEIAGNGVTWNFSGLLASNSNTFSSIYVNPSTLPGASIYVSAGSNVALNDSGGFYKSSSTKLEYLGDMRPGPEIFDITPNPGIMMQYPFSYGSSFTDNANGTMSTPSATFNITATISVSANGQGTLILPSNPNVVYNNVLKVKTNIFMLIQGTGTLSSVTGTNSMTQYEYYVNGQKFPVLWAQYSKLQIPAFGVNQNEFSMDHNISFFLGLKNLNYSQDGLILYPNPSQQKINLNFKDMDNYSISIYSIFGQLYYQGEGKNQVEINCSEWPNGVYILETHNINHPEKKYISKIIKN